MYTDLISNAFASTKTPSFPQLESLAKPPIHTLMELMHGCSNNKGCCGVGA